MGVLTPDEMMIGTPLSIAEREELEYLRFFYAASDFGPANEDVIYFMNKEYEEETGNKVPKDY